MPKSAGAAGGARNASRASRARAGLFGGNVGTRPSNAFGRRGRSMGARVRNRMLRALGILTPR